jgi:hypothetical protein
MYKILNEEQEQGLWETLASMTYPQLLLILVENSDSENSDDDEDE